MFGKWFSKRDKPGAGTADSTTLNDDDLGAMKPERAKQIIDEYGHVLSDAAPAGMVMDESRLPYPKSEIKTALLMGLEHAQDETLRKMLIAGYTHLAEYQAGVGKQTAGLDPAELKELGQVEQTDNPLDRAKQLVEEAQISGNWTEKVQAEFSQLEDELRSKGFLAG